MGTPAVVLVGNPQGWEKFPVLTVTKDLRWDVMRAMADRFRLPLEEVVDVVQLIAIKHTENAIWDGVRQYLEHKQKQEL